MGNDPQEALSRRERQIMEIVYRLGRAAVSEVQQQIEDPPSYSTVRALLRILEIKGHLRHEEDGSRYLYMPVVPRREAGESALKNLLRNFFNGSREQLVTALLDSSAAEISEEELDQLARVIEQAREEGR